MAVDATLVALVWMVQLTVYPSFYHISEGEFQDWHRSYTRRMGYIAAPLMIAQLGLATLAIVAAASLSSGLYLAGVCATWLATFLVSVPLHKQLERSGKDDRTLRKLASTNWIRTALWSALLAHSFLRMAMR